MCVWVMFRVRFRVRPLESIYFIEVKSLLWPRSSDNLTSLFWNSGLVQIDCWCNSRALMDRLQYPWPTIKYTYKLPTKGKTLPDINWLRSQDRKLFTPGKQ